LQKILAYQSAAQAAEATVAEDPCGLLGNSVPMQKLRAQIRQYADSPFPVLVEGESGSGKEIVASCCLHRLTGRRDKPYFALNCAAISPNLVEPTLFGYAKGAFTGAVQAKSGYFEDAEDGTLFLDEIGELPLDLQPKLLRVLENGEFQRVGETQQRVSRARSSPPPTAICAGRSAKDASVPTCTIVSRCSPSEVPPLREMGDDKVLLLRHYRDVYARQAGQLPFELDDEALERWQAYGFPGNVRELRNIVIRLATKYPGRKVDAGRARGRAGHRRGARPRLLAAAAGHRRTGRNRPAPAAAARPVQARRHPAALGAWATSRRPSS
jgi:transcriptional regulator with GAF, ATPase, and Fis domain